MVAEHGVSRARELDGVLGFVKMDEVSAKASVGKTMIYHIWPSQAAYRKDLLRLLATESASSAVSVDTPLEGLDRFDTMHDMIEAVASATIDQQTDPEVAFPYSLLLGNTANSEIGEAFADGCQEAAESSVEFLRRALEHYGHDPVEDEVLADFVVLARAILRGLSVQICLGDRALSVDGAARPHAVTLARQALSGLVSSQLGLVDTRRIPAAVG